MPQTTPLEQESQLQNAFYTPTFEVMIGEERVSPERLGDVVQLVYKDSIKELDTFELTVNNWDASNATFKFVGSETADSLQRDSEASRRQRLFEPRNNRNVEVRMGYLGDLRVMMAGKLTSMEPNFPASGAPTLTVRGVNELVSLRTKQYTTAWTEKENKKRDSDIARAIGTISGREGRRFPYEITIDRTARNQEPELTFLAQENQYDIDFLFGRARTRGYVIFLQEQDPNVRGSRRRVYFGPSQSTQVSGLRDVTFELEWGKSLIDFRPTLTTARQVFAVQVRGWNRRTRERIAETVDLNDSRFDCNRDLIDLLPAIGLQDFEEVVVDEPMYTRAQARERAYAILSERFKQMVTATGTTIGLPDLRSGQRVLLKGIGSRFGGTYFVTETTHTVNDSGYITRFTARREDQS